MLFLLFFASGAAALVYEVVWARSLGLVFGASHLAVTTVLAVYMAGQAIGSWLLGARADRTDQPLRLYGILEIGTGLSGLAFLGLMRIYPTLYAPVAQVSEESRLYLTTVRIAFAVMAMIVPTTLMGGTLPALSRFVAGRAGGPARQVSFLYASNTLGAVAGTLVTGFVLLNSLGVTATTLLASCLSMVVGIASILLQRRSIASQRPAEQQVADPVPDTRHPASDSAIQLAILGIGVSGFCALGYEILWTRMLTLVVGTSVYSFTIMLGAFLAGIALGSYVVGVLGRRVGSGGERAGMLLFAATQVAVGLSALTVTILMRDLPGTADRVQAALAALRLSVFGGRLVSSFFIAFAYLLVPAFFMGMAFPMAGAIVSSGRERIGSAIGRLLTANTIGAILGSAVSGYVLIYLFGIERSLQMLVVINVATGLAIATGVGGRRRALVAMASCAALILIARGAFPTWGRVWDQKFFAIYANSGRSFDTPERIREHLADTEVLYYHEGVNETVSVVRPRGDVLRSFIVNGRPEASTAPVDVQLQKALGHLPMLLHPDPRRVFVLGTGTGMTLGATAAHPAASEIVLAEIEGGVLGVARAFEDWNGHVLDDPRLRIVIDDGRNYLATTRRTFDVITADPIHPWSGGAAYLYTREFYDTMSRRLAPGGIVSQWLPLYELSENDIRTVVRTFDESFPNVLVWLTYYDAILVGSNGPIRIDEAALERRMTDPRIQADLAPVQMGTADDLLSFFLTGDVGARAFGARGQVNTDDNLVLEFSAPASQGRSTDGDNVAALGAVRETPFPYLSEAASGDRRREHEARWNRRQETHRLFDDLHARFLRGERNTPEIAWLVAHVHDREPGYAPLRFLLDEMKFEDRTQPALVSEVDFAVRMPSATLGRLRVSAVRQFVGRGRVLVSFVDNERHEIFGQRYLLGSYDVLEDEARRFAVATLQSFHAAALQSSRLPEPPTYGQLAETLRREGSRLVGRLTGSNPRPAGRT